MSHRMLEQTPEVNEAAGQAIAEIDEYFFPAVEWSPSSLPTLEAVKAQKLEAIYSATTLEEVEAARAIPWE